MARNSFHITLPDEVYSAIDREARELGITTASLVRLIVVDAHKNGVKIQVHRNDVTNSQIRRKK